MRWLKSYLVLAHWTMLFIFLEAISKYPIPSARSSVSLTRATNLGEDGFSTMEALFIVESLSFKT